MQKIKVLVIDDSVSVRNLITEILNQDPEIQVIGVASDPYEAVAKIAEELPDVITLDIEMPRMNGLTFLSKLMKQHPLPVVVISSVTGEGSDIGIKALKLGAREIITKPLILSDKQLEEYSIRITDAVKASALSGKNPIKGNIEKGLNKDIGASIKISQGRAEIKPVAKKIILIGASTGGTEVISKILKNVRNDLPGILIVQHMSGEFTGAFAKRLNTESNLLVKEAEDGDIVRNGCAYIANGYCHLQLKKEKGIYTCKFEMGSLINRHRPSVDVLFKSACNFPPNEITAILLTGMGADGARGLLELKQVGAMTLAQDEKSSVIFGMPKEAIKLDAVKQIVNPDELINWLNTTF